MADRQEIVIPVSIAVPWIETEIKSSQQGMKNRTKKSYKTNKPEQTRSAAARGPSPAPPPLLQATTEGSIHSTTQSEMRVRALNQSTTEREVQGGGWEGGSDEILLHVDNF